MKKLLHCVGLFLCVLSIWFLYSRLMPNLSFVLEAIPTTYTAWVLFVMLCLAYAVSLNALAFAWACQVGFVYKNNSQKSMDANIARVRDKIGIYAKSQIGKYIPGNVFQYIGRSLLASEHGLDAMAVLKSSLYEIISLVSSILMIILVASQMPFSPLLSELMIRHPHVNVMLIFIFLIITLVVLFIFYEKIKALFQGYFYPYFWLAFLFHLASAAIFLALWSGVLQQQISFKIAYLLVFAYLLSWLIGFVTPGSPGGIGVREAVFVLLVGHHLEESQVLLLLTLSRVLTSLGDILFFMEGVLIKKLNLNSLSTNKSK